MTDKHGHINNDRKNKRTDPHHVLWAWHEQSCSLTVRLSEETAAGRPVLPALLHSLHLLHSTSCLPPLTPPPPTPRGNHFLRLSPKTQELSLIMEICRFQLPPSQSDSRPVSPHTGTAPSGPHWCCRPWQKGRSPLWVGVLAPASYRVALAAVGGDGGLPSAPHWSPLHNSWLSFLRRLWISCYNHFWQNAISTHTLSPLAIVQEGSAQSEPQHHSEGRLICCPLL